MTKKSFSFYKDFFGQWFAGGTGKRENEYTIFCTPIKGWRGFVGFRGVMTLVNDNCMSGCKAMATEPPAVVECRKAFYIISNYRYPMGLQVMELAEWNATFLRMLCL